MKDGVTRTPYIAFGEDEMPLCPPAGVSPETSKELIDRATPSLSDR